MSVKCIAIGNRIMGDDAIGIRILEALSPRLKQENIAVILAETDADYALSQIEDGDFLLILDAACLGISPGAVTFMPLQEATHLKQKHISAHQQSLLHLLSIYQKQVAGFVIGIEAAHIGYGDRLSEKLQNAFLSIEKTVMDFILATIRLQ